jgi:hypothetical protein
MMTDTRPSLGVEADLREETVLSALKLAGSKFSTLGNRMEKEKGS